MADLTKALEKWSGFPWRGCLITLGVSFAVASTLSTVLAQFFLPKDRQVGGRAGVSTAPSTFTVTNPGPTLNKQGLDLIMSRNIFNSAGAATDEAKKPVDDKAKAEEVTKSDLPVKLMGTIYGGDPYTGIALVENSTKKTINSFMVGDILTKDATIREIHKERIIVERDTGRHEYIEVDRQELARSRRKKKAPPASSSTIAPLATEPPPNAFKEEGFERKEKESVMTVAYKNKLLTTDFTKVLQDAKASPNMVDGELKGFTLTRIRKDSIYEKAGLQNDDTVTEINGVPLTDTAQAIRLLQALKNENEIEVRIVRGGAPMTFTMQIR